MAMLHWTVAMKGALFTLNSTENHFILFILNPFESHFFTWTLYSQERIEFNDIIMCKNFGVLK